MDRLMLVAALGCCLFNLARSASADDRVLFDFDRAFDVASVETRDVRVSLVPSDGGRGLRIDFGHDQDWPGITLVPANAPLDLSTCAYLKVDVRNVGERRGDCALRVDNPGANGRDNCVQLGIGLEPGESGTITASLSRLGFRFSKPVEIVGMRGTPGTSGTFDPSNVTQMLIFVGRPDEDHSFVIDNIRVGGNSRVVDPDDFLPFIDEFGQFSHADWPGKTHSVEELKTRATREAADLAAHPGPTGWNEYGGWEAGPQLEATGAFRTAKIDGKWWLVDPNGRLFWSHGIDCVGMGGATTPITDRRNYFAGLPAEGSPLAAFYGRGNWAPHGYYQGKGEYQTFNFTAANAFRKYGQGYEQAVADMAHRRLRSWGMNTIGNWSDGAICEMDRTPYTMSIWFSAPTIAGSEGYWGQFPDPFDPDFAANLARAFQGWQAGTTTDPYCIGYFIHNELGWGSDTSLAVAALQSPAEQAAKQAFIADLKAKYADIGALNAAWGAAYLSWDALAQSREAPDREKAGDDLRAFYSRLAERYFRTCRDAIHSGAPGRLYLGCRGVDNPAVARAAAEYCDVVSQNLYRRSVADFRLPGGVDAPVLVGEFHFGALDRGMFHTGLVECDDQNQRAASYKSYVEGALHNPQIVGAHWFQYGSQATTGRGDGENYQIGFLDVCDTPYAETIAACREVGYGMYGTRAAR
jgi:hypothetical protein